MASFPQTSPPTPCAQLFPPPYAPRSGKAITITYSDCVFVVLGIRYVTRMRRGHVWPGRLCCILFISSYKRHEYREKHLLNI
jgi:hypothetical protein